MSKNSVYLCLNSNIIVIICGVTFCDISILSLALLVAGFLSMASLFIKYLINVIEGHHSSTTVDNH